MGILVSHDRYTGHNNEAIHLLENEIRLLNTEKKMIDNKIIDIRGKIQEIQSNCDHEYMLESTGPYEDAYTCKKCGHEHWI